MGKKNPYSGTVLEKTFTPVFFALASKANNSDKTDKKKGQTANNLSTAAVIAGSVGASQVVLGAAGLMVSVTSPIAAGVAAGAAALFFPKAFEEVKSKFDVTPYARFFDVLLKDFSFEKTFDFITKGKELEQQKMAFKRLVAQSRKDYQFYCSEHESYLQSSMSSVEDINRRKAVMKDYLLLELSEQLRRSGLNGTFDEPAIERLDPRSWPLKERYNLIKEEKNGLAQAEKKFLSEEKSFKLDGGIISNRIKISKLSDSIKKYKPIITHNSKQIMSDLLQLEYLSAALENVDNIYKAVLDELRPIMKMILRELEDKYKGNVDAMPEAQADALYSIKTLFKDMAEKSIVPNKKKANAVTKEVCSFSDDLSAKYNQVRESIFKNFC